MNRIVRVAKHYPYMECELDVERVIALVPNENKLLFEYTFWTLNDDDFKKVSEVWHKLKDKEL